MDMKSILATMQDLEKKPLTESTKVEECGMDMPPPAVPMGNPVSMNVSLNASGREHVEDLINMMKNAGLGNSREVAPDMMPMRMDMERLRDIMDKPKALPMPEEEIDSVEAYDNEPDEQYGDLDDVLPDGDDLHKTKKAHKAVAGGDNAMALEAEIKQRLIAALAEKKAKPDFLDMDKDGNKKEPMKKALKDKEAKK